MPRGPMRRPMRGSMRGVALASLVGAATVVPGHSVAQPTDQSPGTTTWTVSDPRPGQGAELEAVVALDAAGSPTLEVTSDGQVVLPAAPIGIVTERADLSTGLRLVDQAERTVTEHYTATTGKRATRHAVMRESVLSFATEGGARLDLVVRVADDGLAYRYHLPDREGATVVTGEASSWRVPEGSPAWLLPYSSWYEEVRFETTVGAAGTGNYGHPALFEVGDTYVLVTESGLTSAYPGASLWHEQGGDQFKISLVEDSVSADGALTTPWRTAIVGDLATVTQSTLVDDLAPDAKVDDTSWIHPGKVAWSWLPEHQSPSDFERQKDYVDYAAAHGWPYVLVDEGWNAAWVPELVRYARAKGVDILLWYRWWEVETPEQMAYEFGRITSWGVKGVKIDFMNIGDTHGEGVSRHDWYERVLATTAGYRLLVNFHGSTIPKGLARTWPHLMTREGVRGAEYYTFSADHGVTPEYNTMLPFTRNVIGSMDYTPVTFGQDTRHTSDGHELALSVVYESALQHLAEMPEVYAEHPVAERYLDQVPTVWDDTRLVSGEPGSHAVLARRSGERWFVGGIAAGPARDLEVALDFVDNGPWLVEVVGDDGEGGLVRTGSTLSGGDTLTVPVAENGGFAAIACRASQNRTSCDEPVYTAPDTTLSLDPAETVIEPGGSLTVAATFALNEGDPVHAVTMAPVPVAGWDVEGEPIRRARLDAGEQLSGQWTFTAPSDQPTGFVELPVAVELDQTRGSMRKRIHVEQAVGALVPPPAPSGTASVSDLVFLSESNGWGPIERDMSNGETDSGDGGPLTIGGTQYATGLGVHAPSSVTIYLGEVCTRFTAQVGVDDEVGSLGTVAFRVAADDGETLAETGVIGGADGATALDLDVTGVRLLTLEVADGGDGISYDHADWADATLTCQ